MKTNHRYLRRECKRIKNNKEPVVGRWLAGRKGIIAFLAVFGVLIAGFYIFIGFVSIYNCGILPAYHRFIAAGAARILSLLGEQAIASDVHISSARHMVQIVPGCDAVEATALYVCAVLAFPAGLLQKAAGVVSGVLSLMALNFARIVILFLLGIYTPSIVEFMHIEVMQGLFILFAVVLWVVWLLWLTRKAARCAGRVAAKITTVSPSAPAGS